MLANRLKQWRTAKGMTVKELSVLSGVSAHTIRDIENKSVIHKIAWDTMMRLSSALGLSANAVFPTKE